jgi:hypothetical protein
LREIELVKESKQLAPCITGFLLLVTTGKAGGPLLLAQDKELEFGHGGHSSPCLPSDRLNGDVHHLCCIATIGLGGGLCPDPRQAEN